LTKEVLFVIIDLSKERKIKEMKCNYDECLMEKCPSYCKECEIEIIKYPDCPTFDFTCPYCLASGECIIDNPKEECDEYWYYNQEEEEDEI